MQSRLGWISGGQYQATSNMTEVPTLMVNTAPLGVKVTTHMFSTVDAPRQNLDQFWNLESIGITESPSSFDDDQALESFNQTVKLTSSRAGTWLPGPGRRSLQTCCRITI